MDRELESGTHSPEEWIRLLFGLQASGFSGQLTLSSGHKSRHFLFLQGHATDFWSDFKDESLCRTLAKAKLVEANALLDLTDAEAEIAVLSEEMLSEEKLEAHQIERVETGLKIPLKIRSGTWSASKVPELEEIAIPRALYSPLDLWNTLFAGVQDSISSGDLLAWAGEEGRLFTRAAQVVMPYVEAANDSLLAQVTEASSLGKLLDSLDSPQEVPARLWILTAAGILRFEEAATPKAVEEPVLEEKVESVPSEPNPAFVPKTSEPETVAPSTLRQPRMSRTPLPTEHRSTGNRASDLAAEHKRRMGQDYYGFLGLSSDASPAELRDVARKLAQRMNALSRSASLPEETRVQVKDMLAGVQRVYGTFTDRKRKEDYDAKLDAGRAPVIQVRGASSETTLPAESQSRSFQVPGEKGGGWGLFKKGGKG